MSNHVRIAYFFGPLILLLAVSAIWTGWRADDPHILVFSKTEGYRHASIEHGVAAIRQLGDEHGFAVDATEDAAVFAQNTLRQYDAVVFLNTTGDVLDDRQQAEFERFIQAGGGYVGVHAATDTEYDWPWYGRLAGAYFESHPNNPNVREGTFVVVDKSHGSTDGLPDRWERVDEFYNFRSINPALHVLIEIDESTYEGGTNGDHHPMSWYHEYDGGRAWYTAMGHTEASYSEPLFLQHLLGGIRYAIGSGTLDYGRARPEENRFNKVVLTQGLNEPIELTVLPDGRVLFIERGGRVHLYRPAAESTTQIAALSVSTKYSNGEDAEDGLLGIAADPNFADNGWIYLYYSPAGNDPKNVLARVTMRGDSLDLSSRKVMLEIPVQRDECCHTGGSIAFDAEGNLYLSTGDNTNPFATGYAPIDERPGREPWDAQRSAANTNDLRGKILRITPRADGSYTIPNGNLFPPGTPNTRPEIYTMGHRNPYRISVDQRTGYLYWGDVGPDAGRDSVDRGPAGHDEFNQARAAGNFGWPYFIADNKRYRDFDFGSQTPGRLFDPVTPENDSPNNTGLERLPPAKPAYVWYPAAASKEFPLLGTGGRTAMAGPVYYRADFAEAERPFPAYYDGKLFLYEWMRGWILAVTMDEEGDLVSMERFMPSHRFSNPIDMAFGPTGDLYILEYGTTWFSRNDDARLVRIEYNAGNRTPVAAASVDASAGATPHVVAFSSKGTADADGDSLRYEWTISDESGTELATLTGPNPTFTFEEPGVYAAALTVTDEHGARATAEVAITAGNSPPEVAISLSGGNRTFIFPDTPVEYSVSVRDREDGSLEGGEITADQVAVTADYLAEGYDQIEIAQGHRAADAFAAGRTLVEVGTCLSCHQVDRASIGPSYVAVAQKYKEDPDARADLAAKIREGGSGVWGEVMMPPHPQLSETEAQQMVDYILSLADERAGQLPVAGTYMPPASAGRGFEGAVVLRAAYTDRGASGVPGVSDEETLVLRPSTIVVANGILSEGVMRLSLEQSPVEITIANASGAHAHFKQIDLTGITAVRFVALTPRQMEARGGSIEVRLGSPEGRLIGRTEFIENAPTPTSVQAVLEPTTGMHDVYFVFKNERVNGEGGLFVVTTAEFLPSGTAENDLSTAASDGEAQSKDSSPELSTRSTLETLLANEDARAVLDKHVPGMTSDPRLEQALHMSVRDIAPYAPDVFTEEVLQAIDADLARL